MDNHYNLAGKGLKLLFLAEIFLLGSNFIPVLSVACLSVGFLLSLVGLNTAAQVHHGFQRAMSLLVVEIAVNFASLFVPEDGLVALVLVLVGGALGLAVLYQICTTAAKILEERGNSELAQQGQFVWKLNLVCTALTLGCTVLTVVPLMALVLTIVFTGVAISSLVGGALYLMFLYQTSGYLRN